MGGKRKAFLEVSLIQDREHAEGRGF